MKGDFQERDFISRTAAAARELRAQKGVAGIDGPLASIQEQLLRDFKQSASIGHSGDKGAARENILRKFLAGGNCLPLRYGVTERTSFVVAMNGELSLQMDIVIYDAMNAPRLFDLGGIQYFPVECVYGTIQVKSDLPSADSIREALDNLASFKSLKGGDGEPSQGFGILFTYDASMKWESLFRSIEEWEAHHPPTVWPNMVVVLNQGTILNHDGRRTLLINRDLVNLAKPQLWPILGDDSVLVPCIWKSLGEGFTHNPPR